MPRIYSTLLSVAAVFGILIAALAPAQAAPFTYDFNSFASPAGPGLSDQDGWSISAGDKLRTDSNSHDGSVRIFGVNNPGNGGMVHLRDGNFLMPDYANATTGVFGADLFSQDWGSRVAIGTDADGVWGGSGYAVFVDYDDQRNQFRFRGNNFSTITVSASSLVPGTWIGTRVEIDFLANGGAGSGTVFVRDILNNGSWQVVSAMQNINLGLTPGSGDVLDPGEWNASIVNASAGVNGFDNLFFDAQYAVPAPGALLLLGFGLIGLGAARRTQ